MDNTEFPLAVLVRLCLVVPAPLDRCFHARAPGADSYRHTLDISGHGSEVRGLCLGRYGGGLCRGMIRLGLFRCVLVGALCEAAHDGAGPLVELALAAYALDRGAQTLGLGLQLCGVLARDLAVDDAFALQLRETVLAVGEIELLVL